MHQLYFSVSSRSLIFSAIIFVLICQAMSRHRFNHNHLLREQKLREKSLENVKEELPKLLRLFLKPPFIDHHKSEKLNHWSHGQETPPQASDKKINTSCGRVNCENVTNYPLQLIKNLLARQTAEVSEEVPIPASEDEQDEYVDEYENEGEFENEDETEKFEGTARDFARSFDADSWLYPNEYQGDNYNLPRNKYECEHYAENLRAEQHKKFNAANGKKGSVCDHKIKEINPKESIDEENQPITIVNDGSSIIIKGYECTAGIDCTDNSMSENVKYYCLPHWSYYDLCILNEKGSAIIKKHVAIEDGCNCTISKETQKY